MAQITSYPFLRQLRSDTSSYVQEFQSGHRVRSGRGLAFWFRSNGASISEIPMDDRQLPFMLRGHSADYQELTIYGTVIWRVIAPEALGDRMDFAIDLKSGRHIGEPMDQLDTVLVSLVRQSANSYLTRFGVREVLDAGIAPLQFAITDGMTSDSSLSDLGLTLVKVHVANLEPRTELARALKAPVFEHLQKQADEALLAGRSVRMEH
jgi:hypothetical protein